MIDEKKLIERVKQEPTDGMLTHEIIEAIKEQPKIGDWIPCSERLPEVEVDVLLSLRNLDVFTGFRANTDEHFYVEGVVGFIEYENVLAWQPLPEPYKP